MGWAGILPGKVVSMICGFVGAVLCWFVSKSIITTIFAFYFFTGIRKSGLWLGIPSDARFHLPLSLWHAGIGSFIRGVLLWPVVLIGCGGDPLHHYFRELEQSGMPLSKIYKRLKNKDELDKWLNR